MKYEGLFTLNPIETVIKINKADERTEAQRLISSFVVTPSLAKTFDDIVLPQLSFLPDIEGKGIFIVGNYGTGKSHVMIFISVLAEDSSYLDKVMDPEIRGKFSAIAGKYVVRRTEIVSQMSLYGIITTELSNLGKACGFEFSWKPMTEVVNIKDEFKRFMEAFEAVQPEKGVLLVVDELLHYLQGRNDHDLENDLAVLRAVGEFCDGSRFAFMAGLQQSLFNNPRFNHMAQSVNRVKQRFHDVVINDRNVFELVEQYLFRKDGKQRDDIRHILQKQFSLYEKVAPDIERFIAAFPAHPNFIDEFQRVYVVERREILTVLTKEARKLMTKDVDENHLDLITADKYWQHVEQDQGLNANQTVATVKKHVSTMHARIKSGFGAKEDKTGAICLVNALAVHRLTTTNLTDHVGMKPDELKNNLLWRTALPMLDADFLTAAAKRLLDLTREVNNGQFLTVAESSGQYYIDPTRTKDYEQDIRTYAKSISRDTLQRYLNEMTTRALELESVAPVQENRLWEYAIMWPERNVQRPGWLFFGFPSQRTTAQPPKDFYTFFLPSKRITGREDPCPDNVDEIYCFLEEFPPSKADSDLAFKNSDDAKDTYLDTLQYYAAARELAANSGGQDKTAYSGEAKKKLDGGLVAQFNEQSGRWMSVRFNGIQKTFEQWIAEQAPALQTSPFRTRLDALAQTLFRAHFENKYPDYPVFSDRIYEQTRLHSAQAAIEIICGAGPKTNMGRSVLRGLGLYENDALSAEKSPWLKLILERLQSLGEGQVLNQSDLVEKREERSWMKGAAIEAEWVHVLITAGVEAGLLVVTGSGNQKFDAANISALYQQVKKWEDIVRVARPADVPIQAWRTLFKLLGCNTGLLANPTTYVEAINEFQTKLAELVSEMLTLRQGLTSAMPFADDNDRQSVAAVSTLIGEGKQNWEKYQVYNSRAKMVNLTLEEAQTTELQAGLAVVATTRQLSTFLTAQRGALSALERYQDILQRDAAFAADVEGVQHLLHSLYCQPEELADVVKRQQAEELIKRTLNGAFSQYRSLHKKHALDSDGDKRKKRLMEGPVLKRINKLVNISVIHRAGLEEWRAKLSKLGIYHACTDEELLSSPTGLCPQTKFDPRNVEDNVPPALEMLEQCEQAFAQIEQDWTEQLLRELEDPAAMASIGLLSGDEARRVAEFLRDRRLPSTVDDAFINAVNTVFSGLRRRPVKKSKFAEEVLGGAPLRPEEARKRFEKWLQAQVGQEKPESVRIVLED